MAKYTVTAWMKKVGEDKLKHYQKDFVSIEIHNNDDSQKVFACGRKFVEDSVSYCQSDNGGRVLAVGIQVFRRDNIVVTLLDH